MSCNIYIFFSQVIIYLIVLRSRYRFYHSGEMSLFLMGRWQHREDSCRLTDLLLKCTRVFLFFFCSPLFLLQLKSVIFPNRTLVRVPAALHSLTTPSIACSHSNLSLSSRNWSTLYIYNGFCIIRQQSALCTR